MRYVKNALKRAGFRIKIFSLCTAKSKAFHIRSKNINIDENEQIKYVSSFPRDNKISKILNMISLLMQISYYLLFKVKKNESVILYHSYRVTKCFLLWYKFKNIKTTIEIEEIYGYAANYNKKNVDYEVNLLKQFENYIVVNDMIPKKLNLCKNNFIVSYGVYNIPKKNTNRFDDGYIHVVYAGTIEKKKLGALNAIDAAQFLPDNYLMHIVGFGKDEVIRIAEEKINKINSSVGKDKVKYHGMLKGIELSRFLHKCHIGLSSNVMRQEFANNTFPSKVITYISHELSIVLGYAECFDNIRISHDWTFFYECTPQAIAQAIVNAKNVGNNQSNVKMIKQLDSEFVEWLRTNIG